MKKNTKRALQSLDTAQLATVSGGAAMEELRGLYQPGSGWYEFYDAAARNDGLNCSPRWNY
jgi:hypothetical protein